MNFPKFIDCTTYLFPLSAKSAVRYFDRWAQGKRGRLPAVLALTQLNTELSKSCTKAMPGALPVYSSQVLHHSPLHVLVGPIPQGLGAKGFWTRYPRFLERKLPAMDSTYLPIQSTSMR